MNGIVLLYQFDNSAMLEDFRKRGFYVADQSHCNYIQTYLSLASSLNFHYLDDLLGTLDPASEDRRPLRRLIADNQVARILRGLGYRSITLSTGFEGTDNHECDEFLAPLGSLTEFESILIDTSTLSPIIDSIPDQSLFNLHRRRILYALDQLPRLHAMKGPFFVFSHIMAPHPPFVFDEHGGPVEPDDFFSLSDGGRRLEGYQDHYRRQIAYITGRILKAIDAIVDAEGDSAVIVLQSDHGPSLKFLWDLDRETYPKERFGILNAIYAPRLDPSVFYPTETPVNTFRIILNGYFGGRLPLLEDKTFFSTMEAPYNFTEATEAGAIPQPCESPGE